MSEPGPSDARQRAKSHPRLAVGSGVGAVHLIVTDLEGAVAFYTGHIGLRVRVRDAESARLGAGDGDLLVLAGRPAAPRARGTTGLYHFALLVPTRADLADALRHLVVTGTPLTGGADHGVSEAVYLSDPEGNGIEIYRDRPRAEWPREGDSIVMTTDPLDLHALLAESEASGAAWSGLPAGTRMGHVHLRVARIADSERFYVGVLGFDLVTRYGPAALFVSAGGYHHHVGLNTWAGEGAPAAPEGAAGLHRVEVRVPDAAELERLRARLNAAGEKIEPSAEGFVVRDPSGHRLAFGIASGPAR